VGKLGSSPSHCPADFGSSNGRTPHVSPLSEMEITLRFERNIRGSNPLEGAWRKFDMGCSSNGKTTVSKTVNVGSIPTLPAVR
jgi:hypothetical protein